MEDMHKFIASLLLFLILVVLACSLGSIVMKYQNGFVESIDDTEETSIFSFIIQTFAQTLVLYSHAIPMSIYVAIEIYKTIQINHIHGDKTLNKRHLMTSVEELMFKRKKAVKVCNSEVLENLGQINLLLADKTGTLTRNQMILRSFYCDNRVWKIEEDKIKEFNGEESKLSSDDRSWIQSHLDNVSRR